MLELRPNCELCDKDLLPNATDANICTFECTFCTRCVEDMLRNVCPNCGGGFAARPIRPASAHRPGLSLGHQPASVVRVNSRLSAEEIEAFVKPLVAVAPEDR